ncbi:MAG: LamG domain-containing protein [Thermoanaerobaculia bacterium]
MKPLPSSSGVSLGLASTGFVSCSAMETLNDLQSCTIEAWFTIDEPLQPSTGQCIAAKPLSNGFGLFLLGGIDTQVSALFGSSDDVNGGKVSPGLWHHVAAVYDSAAGTVTVYLDGEQVAQKTGLPPQSLTSASDVNFMIGASQAGTQIGTSPFDGRIASVRVWDVARTEEDLLNDAVNIAVIDRTSSPNLRLFIDFTNVPAVDRAGGNNALTFTNAMVAINSGGMVLANNANAASNAYAVSGTNPALDFGGTAPYTVDGWFYPTGTSGTLVGKRGTQNTGASEWALRIAYQNGNQVAAWRNPQVQPSNLEPITSSAVITRNNWYHFAVTYDEHSQIFSLYVNGNLHAAQSAPENAASVSGQLMIGTWRDDPGNFIDGFTGVIQDVRVWNKCLMQADIRQWMYNQPVTGPDLVASFDFTQSPPVDLTGNNTITLMGGAAQSDLAVSTSVDAGSALAQLGVPVPVNAACLNQRIDPPGAPPDATAAPQPEPFSGAHYQIHLNSFLESLPAGLDQRGRDKRRQKFEDGYARARQMVADNPNLLKVVSVVKDGPISRLVYHGVSGDIVMMETTAPGAECVLWWISFVFTITIGLLSALGILPPVGQIATRLYNLLTRNVAVSQAMTVLIGSAAISVTGCMALIKTIYDQGLMWSVLKLALAAAGFWVLLFALKTVVFALAGGAAIVQAAAGFIVWSTQVGLLVARYNSSCPR